MSKPHKSGSFSDLGRGLAPKVEQVQSASTSPLPVPAVKDDDTMESFSTKLSRGTKRRLKMASGVEDRTVIQILEEAIAEYMARRHPSLD